MTTDDTLMPLADVGFIITPHSSLPNVYLISKLRLNLASICQLCKSGNYLVIFSFSFCCVHDLQYQKLIKIDRKEKGLYILDESKVLVVIVAVTTTSVDLSYFHLTPSSSSFFMAFLFRSSFIFSFEIFSIHKSF
jgi:hypothetical protein